MSGPLSIRGRAPLVPGSEGYQRCVWCGQRTDVMMATPGRPDLGSVPLNAYCAAEVIWAYQDWVAGHALPAETVRRLERMYARALTVSTAAT